MPDKALQNNNLTDIKVNTYILYMRRFVYIAMSLFLLACPPTTIADDSKSISSPEQLEELALNIEAAEKSLRNIIIDLEIWMEKKADLSDPCEPWLRTPIYTSCTIWLTSNWPTRTRLDPQDKPQRHIDKARIDVHKEVREWKEGLAPYSEKSYSVAFNGQYGRILYHKRGPRGNTLQKNEGRILPEFPSELKWGLLDRLRLTLYFCFEGKGYTFSDIFKWADDPNSTVPSYFEFTFEAFEGVQCIKITLKGSEWSQKNWWLDPARGFALVGYKHTAILKDGTQRLRKSIEVTQLKEVADGIWWPIKATVIIEPLTSGEPYRRIIYQASNVVANDPNFNENVFKIDFPDGYLIDDQVTGKKYRVGEDPNDPKN